MRRLEKAVTAEWQQADQAGESRLPHEFLFRLLRSGVLESTTRSTPRQLDDRGVRA